ncbi:hypothetical protein WICMUC_004039 [Wickerhamomyces mucosus]|uniref:2,4-dienoyl-CoA reductase [(3E)-enoyl-CoA-producing] n=1 Tax=Wickerhamomyces mucosus TaxID=1378264 RepID=A0A9P8PJ75_9ASCO|nr:hypothetical protein WICMUC_004039 [Wickerhamomyces mucosus]
MGLTLDQSYYQRTSFKKDLFKGKVAFVTGGAGSICRVQVEALVLLGANVAIIGRDQQKTESVAQEIQSLRSNSKVIGIGNTDVRDIHSLIKAVNYTVKQLGRIDFVIAGAAGNFISDFNSLSSNAFKSVISIDLLGSFNTIKSTFNELIKSKGSIIFVSATLHYYGIPFQSHVSAAKAGIDALSNALAVELGPLGIRSNCIAPGIIKDTEGFNRLKGDGDEDSFAQKIPLQRLGTKEDIANATVFLFSEAGNYITGDIIVIDGGAWHTFQPAMESYPKLLKKKLLGEPKL